ncbi:hypothetical protein JOB18_016697 [Solea senegalensis]|uniref:Uncharacterized protein n=1 Tax=Solea senegalensis TaxID=28829 RepID=A0AAV6QP54_SOLSE|nr:hypothetical protein JOB18_016697 [Solea senegalensis]
MKDHSSKQLHSPGGRLNENLVVWQRTSEADEKLRRLIRKPGRLDDEKPDLLGRHCELLLLPYLTRVTRPPIERENERD